MADTRTCNMCIGTGKNDSEGPGAKLPCLVCDGSGSVPVVREAPPGPAAVTEDGAEVWRGYPPYVARQRRVSAAIDTMLDGVRVTEDLRNALASELLKIAMIADAIREAELRGEQKGAKR